jgi:tRNA1(Val) A37 N6-methylase TrmN6
MQIVYSYPGSQGKLVLVEAMKNGGAEMSLLPPFFIYAAPGGDYTAEMARLYEP